ncbi:rCG29973 [Rattus norvegicus]|uniref:RCG29973 n=1 Tax=Rattus norvegicus TaxID=10116 RepID=A6IMD7_RAT|nr:rCG29973 [Rattus norvegicus]
MTVFWGKFFLHRNLALGPVHQESAFLSLISSFLCDIHVKPF